MNLTNKKFAEVCSGCEIDCCKKFDVFLSEFDKSRIRKINQDPLLFDGNYFNTKNRRCPFYDSNKKICAIYNYRPLDCRLYPYAIWFERGRIELWTDPKCPLSKHLAEEEKYYNECMETAKRELLHWSEGEVFSYLISEFNIQEFKQQALNCKQNKHSSKKITKKRAKKYLKL